MLDCRTVVEFAGNKIFASRNECAVVQREILIGLFLSDHSGEVVFIAPVVDGKDGSHPGAWSAWLRLEKSELAKIGARLEGVDGSGTLVGNSQQVAGFIESELNRIDRIAADNGELARLGRPAINRLPLGVNKVDVTGSVDGAAGNIEEAASNFFDLCAGGEHRGGFDRVRPRRAAGNVQPGEFALANFDAAGLIVDGIVKRNFAIAITVDVAATDIFRIDDFDGGRKRLIP